MIHPDLLSLLRTLIATPSFSKEESAAAEILEAFFRQKGLIPVRKGNNIWVRSHSWEEGKPIVLLNSHHDTVRPVEGWTRDPFSPQIEGDRLYGLGSNDAGGSLVALTGAFLSLQERCDLPFNLILAATAEEEISGAGGIASLLPEWPPIDCGIIGEPTGMQMAVAEKGLMVIDAEAQGKAGHAAREEGINAIYIALEDIEWLRRYRFDSISELLGPVKLSVTMIEGGYKHNVVPDTCRFVIDVRTNEHYSNEEVFSVLEQHLRSRLRARSYRLQSSGIPPDHPLVESGSALGLASFGSPTLSDQALLHFPTLKIGCGESARSHTADEFIRLPEIEEGILVYIRLLEGLHF